MRYVAAFLLALVHFAALAESPNRPPKYPWHFVDIWWTSSSATERFDELALDFQIVGPSLSEFDLYVAPMGLVDVGGIKAYGGIQTAASGWPDKTSRNMVRIGSGGIFSLWSPDNSPINLDRATGVTGTHYETADYENNFVSVRHAMDWAPGKFTYVLKRRINASQPAGQHWFTASVRDWSSGRETEIGSLRFDTLRPSLGRSVAAFVEVYGLTSLIPRIAVIFDEPRVDGKRRPGTAVVINYPPNGADVSTRYATCFAIDGRAYVYLVPRGITDSLKEESLR